ncbi:MAG: hypothetical protein HZC25_14170 [Rhodospirillales bacterium]|nr:hypothetical protein [Rhodospirillales bacterium]
MSPVQPISAVEQALLQQIRQVQAAATVLLERLPDEILNLPTGETLRATVVGREPGGVLLRTDQGQTFPLRTGFPLAVGATLDLQLTNLGDTTAQFRLLGVDGQPIAPPVLTTPGGDALIGGTPTTAPIASGAQTPVQPLAAGGPTAAETATLRTGIGPAPTLTATVLRAQAAGSAVDWSPMPEPMPAGTTMAVRLLSVQPGTQPAIQAAVATQTTPPPPLPIVQPPPGGPVLGVAPTQTPGAISAPGGGEASAGAHDSMSGYTPPHAQPEPPRPAPVPPQAAPPLVSYARVTQVMIPTALIESGQGAILSATPEAPVLLSGTVAPNTANGQPILQTPVGLVAVATTPAALPPGSAVTLEVVGQTPPVQAGAAAKGATALPPSAWPTLDQALAEVRADDPVSAQRLLYALPQVGPRLAAAMSLYVAAFRQGDLKAWLGEGNLRAIERASGRETVRQLEKDFERISAKDRGRAGGAEWSIVTLPVVNGPTIEAVQLYVSKPPLDPKGDEEGSGEAGGKGGGTRFVVELDMSRLGPLQLDGLMQKKSKRLDFILRSQAALPGAMRRDLTVLVSNICEACGLGGTIQFHAQARFVEVPREAPTGSRRGMLA